MMTQGQADLPWIEKYRPRTLQDVVGNEETLLRLQAIAAQGNMPNLILSGPPGIGKTTSILCLAEALLGDLRQDAVLELNASDDRGIDVVRHKIKSFAQKKVTLPPGRHKIIILDEVDAMTAGAQQALRRTMELYAGTTRFALACNQSSKVIEPIQSRCAILRYNRLSDAQLLKRLLEIAMAESVPYTRDGLEFLIFTAEGDMRQAVNGLQATHAGFGTVNAENVSKVCDLPSPVLLKDMVAKDIASGNVDHAVAKIASLFDKGYAAQDIVTALLKVLRGLNEVPEALRLEYMKHVGAAHMAILEGNQSVLQLAGMVARLCRVAAGEVFEPDL